MPHITLPSGRTFTASLGQTILEASEAAGIRLPYSCRTGRCSTCKCKISGQSIALQDEVGLALDESLAGWRLACVRTGLEDLTVEIEDISDRLIPPVTLVTAKIDSICALSETILSVRLRLPPSNRFKFVAGQHVEVIGPSGVCRSYSLAQGGKAAQIELHVRRVEGGKMSQYWFNTARIDDLLRLKGPKGTFTLRSSAKSDVVFLATGTGMAPVKAMLEEMAEQPFSEQPRSVRVYWGGRQPSDFYWDPRTAFGRAVYTPVISKSECVWSGRRGYVQEALLSDFSDLSLAQVYACGSEAMIRSSRVILGEAGLPSGAFFSDAFVVSSR